MLYDTDDTRFSVRYSGWFFGMPDDYCGWYASKYSDEDFLLDFYEHFIPIPLSDPKTFVPDELKYSELTDVYVESGNQYNSAFGVYTPKEEFIVISFKDSPEIGFESKFHISTIDGHLVKMYRTPFMIFADEKELDPTFTVSEKLSALNLMWYKLTDEQSKEYEVKAEEDFNRFGREMYSWWSK